MGFGSKRHNEVNLDITPLIDVVFLLLIFFMVSTTFLEQSDINITLPSASKQPPTKKDNAINVELDAQGNIYINGSPLADKRFETIKAALSAALPSPDESVPVVINADKAANYQSVISVMDAAYQLDLIRFTFATRERATE